MTAKSPRLPAPAAQPVPVTPAFEALPVGSFERLQAIGARTFVRIQAESADFACRRVEEGQRFLEDLVSNPESAAFDSWAVFLENSLLDAVEFSARWVGLGSCFLSEVANELRREEREIIDDLALQRVA